MTTSARVRTWTNRILNNEFFNDGEDIIYTPAGGSPVTINAFVYRRKPYESKDFSNRGYTASQLLYDVEIRISRDDVPTVVKKSDKVELPLNLGEPNSVFRVADIIGQDLATWRLGLNI